jgi:hypothetical protein
VQLAPAIEVGLFGLFALPEGISKIERDLPQEPVGLEDPE